VAFTLKPGKPIGRELRRIVRKQLDRASKRLLHDHSDEAVHEARKSVKKVVAVMTLLDQVGSAPPRKDAKRVRAARRALSTLRDAVAILTTFDHLRSRFTKRVPEHTSAMIRAHLARRKSTITRQAQRDGSIARVTKQLQQVRRAAKRWPAPTIKLPELPEVFKRSFRASRKAMRRARVRRGSSDFHRWRKRAKTLWYQLRLAEHLVADLGEQIGELKQLGTELGKEHDLVVLRSTLAGDADLQRLSSEVEQLIAMSLALQAELRRDSFVLGTDLHAASPKAFAKDLRRRLMPDRSSRKQATPARRTAV
jgi:CHAD domain-containing protein